MRKNMTFQVIIIVLLCVLCVSINMSLVSNNCKLLIKFILEFKDKITLKTISNIFLFIPHKILLNCLTLHRSRKINILILQM